MAETRENHCCDWNSLPDGIWEDIASRFDLLSTVRLAVCSTSMYRLLIHSRPELFQTPCLLMPDLAEWPVDNLHDEREQTVVPLDMKKIPANLPFMPGQYWAGMNSRWIAIVSESGRSWCLVDVYSQRVIELPSLMAAKIGPRSPPPNPATYARAGTTWIDLRFLKIVVCEVPTASGEYEDYKLIGLFNRGLAYLETSCHQWRWLTVHPVYPPWLSDAIEHAIIVYAVDSDLGCTYCWDTSLLGAKCLPYVIPPPLEEERYGVWFLARSADGQRLMIIRTYVPDHLISTNYIDYMDRDIRDYPGFGCHVFEKDPSSVGPGVFLWRQVNSLGMHSLFLGLNYLMNQHITGANPDGNTIPFTRRNYIYVYTSYHAFRELPYPEIRRHSLLPDGVEHVKGMKLPSDGWLSQARHAAMWFKPTANMRRLIHDNL